MSQFIPSVGRIVEYTLSEADAQQINRRREDARKTEQMLRDGGVKPASGVQIHAGNDVSAGDTFPLIITRVFGTTAESPCNGQVLLDGNDTLWVTSVSQGEGARRFRLFPRV